MADIIHMIREVCHAMQVALAMNCPMKNEIFDTVKKPFII